MARFTSVNISVPVKNAKEVTAELWKIAYSADPDNKMIITCILENKDMTAGKISWIIQSKYGKQKRPQRIINMAKKIGIEIKK